MPPKVLVFGPPRMGTQSTCDALQLLGYDPMYHMREVGKNQHPQLWADLLDAKFDPANHPGGVDLAKLEQMLESFEGIADFPASIFVPELLALYPDAAVILTRRDEARWADSMSRTLLASFGSPDCDRTSPMQPLRVAYHRYCWGNDFATHGLAYARRDAELVRAETKRRGRALLEFEVTQGWEPLCGFLGVEVPDVSFPRSDAAPKTTLGTEKEEKRGGI